MTRTHYVTCPNCDGEGFVDEDGDPCTCFADGADACDTCDGRGEILEGAE